MNLIFCKIYARARVVPSFTNSACSNVVSHNCVTTARVIDRLRRASPLSYNITRRAEIQNTTVRVLVCGINCRLVPRGLARVRNVIFGSRALDRAPNLDGEIDRQLPIKGQLIRRLRHDARGTVPLISRRRDNGQAISSTARHGGGLS